MIKKDFFIFLIETESNGSNISVYYERISFEVKLGGYIYWSVIPTSSRGRDRVKAVDWGCISQLKVPIYWSMRKSGAICN